MFEVEMKVYEESCIVPVLVVPGQQDDLIIGTNVIKFLMHQLKTVMIIASSSLPVACHYLQNVNSCGPHCKHILLGG